MGLALKKYDVKGLRIDFAQRLRLLIGTEKNQKNLKNFSETTGIAMSVLSQWQNPERSEWPSVKNLLRLMEVTGKSADWFLLGDVIENLSAQSSLITDEAVIEEVEQRVRRKYGPKQIRQLPGNPPANKGRPDAAGKGEVRRRAPRTHKKG